VIHSSKLVGGFARAGFAVLALLPFAAANAEFVRVTAANALFNSVYDVTSFTPPGTINPLNTDGAKHGSFQALVQAANTATGTVDVLVADALLGQIIRYTPALGATPASETVVWSYSGSGSGPAHPDGLSLDSAGNLYIVTSKFFDGTRGAVWVLPAAASPTGFAPSPLLVDGTTFATANGVTVLQETVVASSTTAAWGVGDLLVLVGNKSYPQNGNVSELVVYRAASISSVLSGAGPRGAPDQVLITNSQFPNTEFPTGMDFWPPDAQVNRPTLLIATTAGRVLRYDFDPVTLAPSFQVFASSLGIGLQKIKVGLQLEVPYAFATQVLTNLTGRIVQLGAPTTPGTTNLIGSATQGVLEPDGLAVARTAAVTAQSCASAAGCDISNGVDPHQITGVGAPQVSGNVTEQTCVVASDPRYDVNGNCANVELDASAPSVCGPNFAVGIPASMCGGSGLSKTGFALIRTVANGVDNLPGVPLLVKTQEGVDNILPPPTGSMNPSCKTFSPQSFSPFSTIAWAPRTDAIPTEGTIVEAKGDPLGLTPLVDMIGACDSSNGFSRGMSYYGVGLIYNANALGGAGGLTNFVLQKYTNLFNTVDAANISTTITSPAVTSTKGALETALGQVNTYLQQQDFACAANEVVTTNALVANDPNPAVNYPGDAVNNANPWGEVQGRLANLYVWLNTLILGNPTNAEWPLALPDAPPVCGPPVLTLSADVPSIQPNTASTLTWSSQHALSCTASGGWSGSQGLSGNQVSTGALAGTTTFTLSCTGFNNSQVSASTTVTVVPPPTITALSASPSIFASTSGTSSSMIGWSSTNATSCTIAGGGFSATLALAGSNSPVASTVNVTGITATTLYTVNCSNSLGVMAAAPQTTTVTVVTPPAISGFGAIPASVNTGGSTTFSWSLTNTTGSTSCAIGTPAGSVPAGTSSLTITNLQATAAYTLACSNASGGVTATAMAANSVTVTVVPPPQITSFSAPASILSGGTPTLTWNTSNAASCSIAGTPGTYSVPSLAVSGMTTAPAITAATTYTLTCSNSLGLQTSAMATVSVVQLPQIGSFTVSPTTVNSGSSPVLTWTSNAMSCAVASNGGFSATGLTGSGMLTAAPITTATIYTLSCSNASGGVTATATATPVSVTVQQCVTNVAIKASPASVGYKGVSSLTWSESNAASCGITGTTGTGRHAPVTSPIAVSLSSGVTTGGVTKGTVSTAPLFCSTTFTLTCTNSLGKATATTTVLAKDSDGDYDCD
jgi:hypothetical protein